MNKKLNLMIKVIDYSNKFLKGQEIVEQEDTNNILFNDTKQTVASGLIQWWRYLKKNQCQKVVAKLSEQKENGIKGQSIICQYANHYEIWQDSQIDGHYQLEKRVKQIYVYTVCNRIELLDDLIESYTKMGKFATDIKMAGWTRYFNQAIEAIELIRNSSYDIDTLVKAMKWPFGGMGSWNDSPYYQACLHRKEGEYIRYSEDLYQKLLHVLEDTLNRDI